MIQSAYVTETGLNKALLPLVCLLQSALPWVNEAYGRLQVEAVTQEGAEKEKPRLMPLFLAEIPYGYHRVVPDEKIGGLSFFISTGPTTYPEWDKPNITGQYVEKWPLAFILWGSFQDTQIDVDAIRESALQAFTQVPEWQTTSLTDTLQTGVFKGLDYDFKNHRYLMHPFFGLRIEGNFTYAKWICR